MYHTVCRWLPSTPSSKHKLGPLDPLLAFYGVYTDLSWQIAVSGYSYNMHLQLFAMTGQYRWNFVQMWWLWNYVKSQHLLTTLDSVFNCYSIVLISESDQITSYCKCCQVDLSYNSTPTLLQTCFCPHFYKLTCSSI